MRIIDMAIILNGLLMMMVLSGWHHIPAALGWLIGGRAFWESVTNENGHISMNFASTKLITSE